MKMVKDIVLIGILAAIMFLPIYYIAFEILKNAGY